MLIVLMAFFLLALIVFYSSRWLLERPIKNKEKRNAISLLLAIGLSPVLLFLGISLFISILFPPEKERRFSKERWSAYPDKRFEMRKSILKRAILSGKTEKEVVSILMYPSLKDSLAKEWQYYLGLSNNFIDFTSRYLVIKFQNDTVINVSIREISD